MKILSEKPFPGLPTIVFGISLLIPLALLMLYFSIGGEYMSHILFNSDILYFPVLYKDLFIDGYQITGWNIPGAPNFFPDMLLYFLLMLISGKVPVSMFLFAFLQLLAILLIFKYLIKIVFPGIGLYPLALGNLLLSLFFLVTLIDHDAYMTFHLVSNTYHLGTFLSTLIAMVFAIKYITTNRNIFILLLLLTGIAAITSDRLFIILFCLPFAGSLLAFTLNSKNYRQLIVLSLVLTGMIVSGLVIFDRVSHNNTFQVAKAFFDPSLEGITRSWNSLSGNLMNYFSELKVFTVIIIVSLLTFLLSTVLFMKSVPQIRKGILLKESKEQLMNLFIILFMLIVFFTPVITGSFQGFDTIRYNIFVFYIGLMYTGVLLTYFFIKKPLIKSLVRFTSIAGILILITFMGIYSFRNKPIAGFKNYLAFYPDVARCIDSLSSKYDLKYGVSTYWHGKPGTTFSKNNVRLYTVYDENLVPYPHVGNENWYYECGYGNYDPPVFNFILLQKPVSDSLLTTITIRTGRIVRTEEFEKFIFIQVNDFKYSRGNPFPEIIENNNSGSAEILFQ